MRPLLLLLCYIVFQNLPAQDSAYYNRLHKRLEKPLLQMQFLKNDTCFNSELKPVGIGLYVRVIEFNGDIACSKEYDKYCLNIIECFQDSLMHIIIEDTFQRFIFMKKSVPNVITAFCSNDTLTAGLADHFRLFQFDANNYYDYEYLKENIEAKRSRYFYDKRGNYFLWFPEMGEEFVLVLSKKV